MNERENGIVESTLNNHSLDRDMQYGGNATKKYYYMGDDTFHIVNQSGGDNAVCTYSKADLSNTDDKSTTSSCRSVACEHDQTDDQTDDKIVYSFCIKSCNPLWTKEIIKEKVERFQRIGKVASIDFVPRKNVLHNNPNFVGVCFNMVFIHIREWDVIQTREKNPKTGLYPYQELIRRANTSRGLKLRAYYPTVSGTYHPHSYEYWVLRENKNPENRQQLVNKKNTSRIINSIKHNYEKKILELKQKVQEIEEQQSQENISEDFCFVEVAQ